MSARDDRRRRKDEGDRNKDRDRRRDKDQHSSAVDAKPIQKPIILLKRPVAASASTSSSQSQSAREKDNEVTSNKSSDSKSLDKKIAENKSSDNKSSDNKSSDNKSNDSSERDSITQKPEASAAPIVLLRSSAAKRNSERTSSQTEESKQDTVQTKQKPKPLELLIQAMKPFAGDFKDGPTTLIDKNMKVKPIGPEYFDDHCKMSTDFFVVTIIGKPSTGKSTILSYLVNDEDEEFGKCSRFKQRSRDQEMESFMYITSDNVIFIEMASLFNSSATIDLASFQGTLETMSLTWNLRLMRWAFSVSHVVLIVSDNILDPNVCQLISSAEMIRPMESSLGEGMYPEIVYVCNKVPQSVLNDKHLVSQYQFAFNSVAGRTPRVSPNVFMIPEIACGANYESCENLKTTLQQFNVYTRATFLAEVLGIPKTPQKYSVHEWYSNSIKSWEDMNHTNYFSSYVKLFP